MVSMDVLSGTPEFHSKSQHPLRETLILGAAFLTVFTSFQALQNLQSSLNQQGGLGLASLACIYGAIFLGSIVTPVILYNLGARTTILLAWLGHLLYVTCNFFPRWAVLIPGSLVLGAVSCPLWTAVQTYLSTLARVSVERDLERSPKVVTTVHAAFSRFSGIFYGFFSTSQLTGNVLSSVILLQTSYYNRAASHSSSVVPECGTGYCDLTGKWKGLILPAPTVVYIMLGVFVVLDIAGLLVTWGFVPDLIQPRYTGREVCRKLRSYWEAFFQPYFWLLVPFFFARGMIFSLHVGLYTESYVSCALGIPMVGFVMSMWGLCTMISSALLGCAARYTGRYFLFAVAFLLDAAILAALLLWHPHASSLPVFFCISALMGLVDGIWSVQSNALIVVLFPAVVDSAFSVSHTWGSLAVSLTFMLSHFLCPAARLQVALGMLSLALLGYVAVEILHRRHLQAFSRDDQHYTLVSSSTGEGEESEDGGEGRGREGEGEGERLVVEAVEAETEFNGKGGVAVAVEEEEKKEQEGKEEMKVGEEEVKAE